MRFLYPSSSELNRVLAELSETGKAFFKGSIVLKSDKKEGWFMDSERLLFADNLNELLFDLNDLQRSIDYDEKIKEINEFSKAFKKCLS